MKSALPFSELRLKLRGVSISLLLHPERMFVPNLVSLLSAAVMRVAPGEVFCDVCSGSGLHAVAAAKLGAGMAYGVDIDPLALKFARLNARLNGVEGRCRFFRGDLTAPLAAKGIKANCLVFSGPQCPASYAARPIPAELRAAVNGGPDGSGVNVRFVKGAGAVLAPGGRFYLPAAGWAAPAATLGALRRERFAFRPVFTACVPAWGRGNNTRDWFQEHQGLRRIGFDYPAQAGGRVRILEARRKAEKPGPAAPRAERVPCVNADFRPGRAA